MGIPDPEEPDEAAAADHKRKGDIAFVGKHYQEALKAYSQALRHQTSNHVVWANRSAVYLRLNKPQAALEDARRARTLDESYTKVPYCIRLSVQGAQKCPEESASQACKDIVCKPRKSILQVMLPLHCTVTEGAQWHLLSALNVLARHAKTLDKSCVSVCRSVDGLSHTHLTSPGGIVSRKYVS